MSETATVIADEGQIDHKPIADTPAIETPDAKEEPVKPTASDELKEVVKRMAYETREAKRRTAMLEQQIEALRPKPEPGAPPTADDMERMIEARAIELIERREGKARVDTFQTAGMAEYSDWNDRCDQIADMGGAENKAFMRAITAIPGGHKIVADLSENPVEAARILALPDIEMTIALVGMRQRPAAEAAPTATVASVSKAPPPIKPITATARAEVNLATMSEADFQKEWNKRTRGK